jgi:hypothetical protein
LKPPFEVTVSVDVPLCPAVTVSMLGESDKLKLGAAETTCDNAVETDAR